MRLPDRCFNTGLVDVVLGILGQGWQIHTGPSLFGGTGSLLIFRYSEIGS